jgi:tetratricopeptide (TPR) repeat protein
VLETLSVKAFERLIPSEWIVRPVFPGDYGIDLEVEIFDAELTTGLSFKVQLKSTDSLPKNGKLSKLIDRETVKYWRSLDVPVLVVMYSARTGGVFAQWAHEYDLFYARKDNSRTVQFKFEDRHRISATSYPKLIDQVRFFRALNRKSAHEPFCLTINTVEQKGDTVDATSLRIAVAQALRGVSRFTLESTAIDPIEVELLKRKLVIYLPGRIASITIHDLPPYKDADAAANDILTLICLHLVHLMGAAADVNLLEAFAQRSTIIKNESILDTAITVLSSLGHTEAALRLIDLLEEGSEEEIVLKQSCLARFHMVSGAMSESSSKIVLAFWIRLLSKEKNEKLAGRISYNIAHVQWTLNRAEEAVASFNSALRLDPGYGMRSYFFAERGRAASLLHRFEQSAADYAKAYELDGKEEHLFMQADALLMSGHYAASASTTFDIDRIPEDQRDAAWLHRCAIGALRGMIDLDAQVRLTITGDEISAFLDTSPSSDEVMALLVSRDALAYPLWYYLAEQIQARPGSELCENDDHHLFMIFTLLARLNGSDGSIWFIFLINCIRSDSPQVLLHRICDLAIKHAASDLNKAVQAADTAGMVEVDRVRTLILDRSKLKKEPSSMTLRMFNSDETYETVQFGI